VPIEDDLALVGLLGARQDLYERALAGAVVSDEGHDLAGEHVKVSAAQRLDVAIVLHDAASLQQWFGHRLSLMWASFAPEATLP